jgi:hypothetical protein
MFQSSMAQAIRFERRSPYGAKCVGDRVQLKKVGSIMSRTKWIVAAAIGLVGIAITSGAEAQSAGGPDAEIALLKQQLK